MIQFVENNNENLYCFIAIKWANFKICFSEILEFSSFFEIYTCVEFIKVNTFKRNFGQIFFNV